MSLFTFIRNLLRRQRAARDLDDEVRAHLELLTEEKRHQGMGLELARRAARIELGGIEQVKEEVREARSGILLEQLGQDIRYGVRQLRRNPGFTAVAVLTLAIGIGANTALFSVVNTVLLHRLPFPWPEQLVTIAETDPDSTTNVTVDFTTTYDLRARSRLFQSMSLTRSGGGALFENGEPERLTGRRVSYDFFETLGVRMALGRSFLPEEDRPDNRHFAILSHELWVRRFGSDPGVIGRVIHLTDSAFTVVGVLPAGFHGQLIPGAEELPEIYTPLGYDLADPSACRGCQHLRLIGRLKPGATVPAANTELNAIMNRIVSEHPASYARDSAVRVESLRNRVLGRVGPALWVLLGAASFVLLIACSNVANLILARATGRTREMAVRAALGAGRRRLACQLLTESLLLAFSGGAAGFALAWWGTRLLASLAPAEIPRLDEMRVDTAVLLFALGISLLTGILAGLAPAVRAARVELNETLKDASKSTEGRSRRGMRRALVTAEVALAFLLAVGAGLMAKTLFRLLNVHPGYDPHNVLTLSTFVYGTRYQQPEVELNYYQQAFERLRATPGVESVAMTSVLPMGDFDRRGFHIQDRPLANESDAPAADTYSVTPDYFRVMRIPILRGRAFTRNDVATSERVALISESCAKSQFPGEDPIGKHIQLGGRNDKKPWLTIVGVVGDVRQYGLDRPSLMEAYIAQAQDVNFTYSLVARTTADPRQLERSVRAAFYEADKTLPVYMVKPLEDYVAATLAERTFTLALLALFGVLALVLAAVGIYGVISYLVNQRTREVGIRVALGASRSEVLAMVLRQGMGLAGLGLGLGFCASLLLTRLLASLLFEVRATDLATSFAAALLLAGVALLACYLPARRAARVDPIVALRYE
ncbi:MAG TPA: ABC transporter permease [Candidatus Binatia bacterium]|nr:ABC transporter permease [Candidatus Binatia bacterium]